MGASGHPWVIHHPGGRRRTLDGAPCHEVLPPPSPTQSSHTPKGPGEGTLLLEEEEEGSEAQEVEASRNQKQWPGPGDGYTEAEQKGCQPIETPPHTHSA